MNSQAVSRQLPEFTIKVFFISIVLAAVLAVSNAYLALKVGMLTSASIPAAMLSMGLLRCFKRANILENNLVQTCASTGEAVAGGVVYTIPALIIMRYWTHFDYWTCAAVAFLGGLLGVLFTIPLRKPLLSEPSLKFPEGVAVASVLQAGERGVLHLKYLWKGGLLGAVLEFAQTGLHVLASTWQAFWVRKGVIVGGSVGFSSTLLGAGYLMGPRVGVSLLAGAVAGRIIGLPILSFFEPASFQGTANATAMAYWGSHLSYVGIGAMLVAACAAMWNLLRDLLGRKAQVLSAGDLLPHERDVPFRYWIMGLLGALAGLFWLFSCVTPHLPFPGHWDGLFIASVLIYILCFGFVISAVCGYFSGMVGVSASPGSAAIIGAVLLGSVMIRLFLSVGDMQTAAHQFDAAVIAIFIGAVMTGAAAITNDNIQDLKVGQILGATPWKQQVMLLLGVLVGALVIPPVMEILFRVYGIADVLPHAGMDVSHTLPAPPAALMATLTQGVFKGVVPWHLLGAGAFLAALFMFWNACATSSKKLSVVAVAMGVYLPLSSTIALFLGALLAYFVEKRSKGSSHQTGFLMACGLVAGAALMNVLVAIPLGVTGQADFLSCVPQGAHWPVVLSVLTTAGLLRYWYRVAIQDH